MGYPSVPIVFAHAGGALIDHDDLMFLFPTVPVMLIGTIVVAIGLRKRGLLGAEDRTVMLSTALAAVAAALSLGAAGIHFAVIQDHLAQDQGFGLFFIGLAWFQQIWALAYLLRRTALLAASAVLVNALVIGVWLVSRTTGLPFGPTPWQPAPIGTLDLFATVFEVALITVILPTVAPRRWPSLHAERMPFERAVVLASFVVMTVALMATLALLGTSEAEASVLP